MGNPWSWCWVLVCLCFVVCNGCLDEERRALWDIAYEFSKMEQPEPLDWSGDNCCSWERVTCNLDTGRVKGLDLAGAGLVFQLNTTLFLPFQELQNLSLSNLLIEGCLPGTGFDAWSKLRKLEIVDLSENLLNDSPISPLLGLPSLRSLLLSGNVITDAQIIKRLNKSKMDVIDLSWNTIVGNISRDICNMTSLRELHLNGNFFFGELPPCITNLTSLRVLDLSHNLLTVRFPPLNFANMSSLVHLSLSHNQLEGVVLLSSFSKYIRLKYLGLSSNSTNFLVQTEIPPANISAQLQVLELSNCNLNNNSGDVPSLLLHQHELYLIDLSNNNLGGNFPMWLIENNTELSYLNLQNNLFVGPLVLPSKVNKNLWWLDISCNMLSEEIPMDINITLPNLGNLNLSRNYFQGPHSSTFIYMKNLSFLDISYNNISDRIAASFIGTQSGLTALVLSSNSYHGPLPEVLNLASMQYLVLSNNSICGEIPTSICENSNLGAVDFSNNKLTGSVPNCIGQMTNLYILDLRGNQLSGSIPMDICNINLQFLDLSKNLLSGQIPSLPNLTYLHLSDNNFNGTFPLPLSFNSNLKTIDLRYNQLGGAIPSIIAEAFPELRVLLLKGNLFEGMISYEICRLKYLRLLDLSNNMLSEKIPSCLSSMGLFGDLYSFQYSDTTHNNMSVENEIPNNILYQIFQLGYYTFFSASVLETDQEQFTTKSRQDYYKGNILNFMSGLDFSSNQLEGSIPDGIGGMQWLRALNFSNNSLIGSIPTSLSNLSNLESLDLSQNSLTGQIPPELVILQSLEVFSVAYNNLSGPTLGTKGQFITFDQSSYKGNPGLCGPPLLKNCSTTPLFHLPQVDKDHDRVGDLILFGSSALFYVIGFWASLAVLYFKRGWRWGLFFAVDRFGDFLVVRFSILMKRVYTSCH